MELFLHGLETIERDAGNARYVQTIDTGIIHLTGTAPLASSALYKPNHTYLINGYNDLPKGLGSSGTLPIQLDYVMRQAGRCSPTILFTIVPEADTEEETVANILGNQAQRTGMWAISCCQPEFNLKPKLLAAPGFTSHRPTDGIASLEVTEGGSGYTKAPTVTIVPAVGDTTGSGATATCTINDDGEVDAVIIMQPGHRFKEVPKVVFEGGGGTGAKADATLGACANPVASQLNTLARRYRAMATVTGPNTTAADAIQYRLDFSSSRLYILDPFAMVQPGASLLSIPADAMMLGLQARIDYEEGFWVSPSNHVLEGVLGTHRPIEHDRSDPSFESQYLNKNHVGTIIRAPSGGFKLYGNRVAESDPLHVFWPVRRSSDTIIESVELAGEPYLDKAFAAQHLIDIGQTVSKALRRWTGLGATLGGEVWLDPSLNTAESMSSGVSYISYDGEPPAPNEHIIFVYNRNTGYYKTMYASAARELARQNSADGYSGSAFGW